MGSLGVFVGGGRMLVGFRRMLMGGVVIALLVMLSGGSVCFGRFVVVFGCFLVFIFRHVIESFRELDRACRQPLLKVLTK